MLHIDSERKTAGGLQLLFQFGWSAVRECLLVYLPIGSAAALARIARNASALVRLWWDSEQLKIVLLQTAVRQMAHHLAIYHEWRADTTLYTRSRALFVAKFAKAQAGFRKGLCSRACRSRRALARYLEQCRRSAKACIITAANAGVQPPSGPLCRTLEQISASGAACGRALTIAREFWLGPTEWLETLCIRWLGQPAIAALFAADPVRQLSAAARKVLLPSRRALLAAAIECRREALRDRRDYTEDFALRLTHSAEDRFETLAVLAATEVKCDADVFFIIACRAIVPGRDPKTSEELGPWARLNRAADSLADLQVENVWKGTTHDHLDLCIPILRLWISPSTSWTNVPTDTFMHAYHHEGKKLNKLHERLTSFTCGELAAIIPAADPIGARCALLAQGAEQRCTPAVVAKVYNTLGFYPAEDVSRHEIRRCSAFLVHLLRPF
jgi:hypothetical protein